MNNKQTTNRIVIGFILLFALNNNVFALTGSGSEIDPYLIQDLADFDEFASDPNYWEAGVYMQLECDPNLAGRVYTDAVIAPDTDNFNSGFQGISFAGIFDGTDHRVSNLMIDDGGIGNDYLGLFGYTENGQINNLIVENVSIRVEEGSFFIGGLVSVYNIIH